MFDAFGGSAMRFRCMRGYWNPVEVNSQDGAQVVFRCRECSVRTCDCLQAVAGSNTEPDTIAVLAAALGEMLDIKPGSIRKQRIECTNRYAKRGLRALVAALCDEIKAARDVGHGFYAIARVISENGPHIDQHTLRGYFREMEAGA